MDRLGIKFHRIPDYFIERYDPELAAWANQWPRGQFRSTRLFTFNEGALADDSPDAEQGKVLAGAWLLGRISQKGIEIEPLSDLDEGKIRAHCVKMQLLRVPAKARLVEPPRPGIPTIPSYRQ